MLCFGKWLRHWLYLLHTLITGLVAQVKFSKRPPWSCLLDELEPVRYQQPNYERSAFYDSEDEDEDEDSGPDDMDVNMFNFCRYLQAMGAGGF